jgi:hypothetical protein
MDSTGSLFFKEIIGEKNTNNWELISFEPLNGFITSIAATNLNSSLEHCKIECQFIVP